MVTVRRRVLPLLLALNLLFGYGSVGWAQSQKIDGELTKENREVSISVDLEKGKTYEIQLRSRQFDPVLSLFDAKNKKLAENDDFRGDGLNSRIFYTPPEAGTFQLKARSYDGKGMGKFIVVVGEKKETPPETIVHNIVKQGFPAAKADPNDLTKSDTAWEVDWTIDDNQRRNSQVLSIRSAKFMYKDKQGQPRWITVAENLQLGEMFVPYDNTSPTFLDIANFRFRLVKPKEEYLGPNCVAPGEILKSDDKKMDGMVLKEVHDDGLRWLNGAGKARRGEKMMLWAMLSAGNYRYIMEYTFKDDGIIVAKVGATAHNYHKRKDDQTDVHLHVGCWRCDVPLTDPMNPNAGGADKNKVSLVSRSPHPTKTIGNFMVIERPFNSDAGGKAREGFADWVPEEFTTLRVQSTVRKNGNDQPTAYDLLPLRFGSVRNFPDRHDFVNHDFWVTRTDKNFNVYRDVPKYSKEERSLDGHPVTIWHSSPGVHIPRAEDFGPDGRNNNAGVALTFWTGFIMRPRNLFDSTPLYEQMSGAKFKGNVNKNRQTHKIQLKGGKRYIIEMKSEQFDSYLYLQDAQGKTVKEDDDGGQGQNSRIEFSPEKDGEYSILAGSFKNQGEGSYGIWIEEKR